MNTGATGCSPVPGRLIPMSACRLSPGPLTTQPITATVRFSTPGKRLFHSGIRSRKYDCTREASSWNTVLVVRPQPGQAVTIGTKARNPND